ncbi:MAG: DUF3179 domain-containing protein [Acidobacteria bacterium]|nr:MAG: DUF3179 domain-containing protein [Acidobacteriota bacterium]
MRRRLAFALPFLLFVLAWGVAAQRGTDIGVKGFQQILPRGTIASIDDPEFVPAEEANLPDDAWVLGFAYGGEAYAYDLNLLNSHEIVNHKAGDRPIAAVW